MTGQTLATAGSGTPVALDYAAVDKAPWPPRWMRICCTIAACVAGASAFLPFTWNVSPWDVIWAAVQEGGRHGINVQWALLLLAMPFLLGGLLVAWQARLAISSPATAVERGALRLAAYAVFGMLAWFVLLVIGDTGGDPELSAILLGPLAAMTGICATLILWWRTRDRDLTTTALVEAAYLGNAVLCLVAFSDRPDGGWWCTLVAGVLMVFELCVYGGRAIFVLKVPRRR